MKKYLVVLAILGCLLSCKNKSQSAAENSSPPADTTQTTPNSTPEEQKPEQIVSEPSLPNGNYEFTYYQAEHNARMPVRVEIMNNHARIFHVNGELFFEESLLFNTVVNKWILSNNPSDAHTEEVGGCRGAAIVEFEERLINSC